MVSNNAQFYYIIKFKILDGNSRLWSFDIKDYGLLHERVANLHPDVCIGQIPKFVLKLCEKADTSTVGESCLSAIDAKLYNALMPFQKEGVLFGIRKQGRCLIADEMGLGKTYQALALADFYKHDWPLLICTTAATRLFFFTYIINSKSNCKILEILGLIRYVNYCHQFHVILLFAWEQIKIILEMLKY